MAEFGALPEEPKVDQPLSTPPQLGNISVVVIGATGVTGRYVVAELLLCSEISSVRIVARNNYVLPTEYGGSEMITSALKTGKLVEHITDMEAMSDEDLKKIFDGVHTFYNCFGSTRSKAGSAARFTQLDMDIPVRFARIAKEMGVRHASLLTSDGASSTSFIHYLKVKGLIENAFHELSFPALSIFRPGLLGRKEQMKFAEKLFSIITTPIQTDDLARGIVEESLSVITGKSLPNRQIYTNVVIKALNAERNLKLRSMTAPSNTTAGGTEKPVPTVTDEIISSDTKDMTDLKSPSGQDDTVKSQATEDRDMTAPSNTTAGGTEKPVPTVTDEIISSDTKDMTDLKSPSGQDDTVKSQATEDRDMTAPSNTTAGGTEKPVPTVTDEIVSSDTKDMTDLKSPSGQDDTVKSQATEDSDMTAPSNTTAEETEKPVPTVTDEIVSSDTKDMTDLKSPSGQDDTVKSQATEDSDMTAPEC